MTARRLLSLSGWLACGGLSLSAAGQDSTSVHAGLPGDAPDSYASVDQCDRFVLDLAPVVSTWGNGFAVGPLLKLTRSEPGTYFNNLPGSSGVSSTYAAASFDGSAFDLWSSPGMGVATGDNAAPSGSSSPTGSAAQFAVAAADFAPVAGVNTSHIIGAIVQIDPAEPTRLYVQRRVAAVSGAANSEARSSLSLGSVDENGRIALRADAFHATGPTAISGSNLLLVDLLQRDCGAINVIDADGGSDSAATTELLRNSATIIAPPSILPSAVAPGTVFAADFAGDLLFGDAGGFSATSTHRGASSPFVTTDHRGTTSHSPDSWFTGSIGTGAVLAYQEISGPAQADAYGISVWGVDAQGGVVPGPASARTVLFPAADPFGPSASVTDNFDGHEIGNNAEPGSDWVFDQIGSQIPFRGGSGSVAVGTDASDRLMVAAHAAFGSFASGGRNSPVNAIAVARLGLSSAEEWTLAAWVDEAAPNGGKAITDGQGAVVGYLEQLDLTTSGHPRGPSMSGPAIDSAGNIWFVASARYIDAGAPDGFRHAISLLRAVYKPDSFAFELESVLSTDQVVAGINSGTDYVVSSIELADRNSLSSGALASGSIIAQPWLGGPAVSDPADPAALGGIVVAASIIYDTNADDQFLSPAGSDATPGSPDEEYQVLLFVSPGASAQCVGDIADDFGTLNGGDGMVGFGDFLALLGLVGPCPGAPGCVGDIADDFGTLNGGDGMVSFGDFLALLSLVGPCP